MNFRLNVFIAVANHLSFTKAARELHVSQPAVSKNIQELEAAYNVQLFARVNNQIVLTNAGKIFLKYAERIVGEYKALQAEMNLLSGNFNGAIHVGASTSIAQYVLPEIIARFLYRFPDIRLSVLTGNSEQIERAVEEHRIDIGLVEGSNRKQGLKYVGFAQDELVMITSVANKCKEEIDLSELPFLPLVLRETGSGTLDVIEKALNRVGLRLSQMNILLQLGNTESIKSFLMNYPSAYAIVSIAAVSKELIENKLKVIEIPALKLEREFAYITQQGTPNNTLNTFIRFLQHFYNHQL